MITLVSEVGTTCNGKLDDALKLADAAKSAGMDYIKYMMVSPDDLMSDKTVDYTYTWAGGTKTVNMYEMLKPIKFTVEEWQKIVRHCQSIGLKWFLTVDYPAGIPIAEDLDCPIYKLSAWDIRHFPLIEAMAGTQKPIWIDLGPATISEMNDAMICIHNHSPGTTVTLLHSTHGRWPDSNLGTIPFLRRNFVCPVGWSSPDAPFTVDRYAVAAGASIVEKRLTLNRNGEGHQDYLALEPKELAEWADQMREVDVIVGVDGMRISLEDHLGRRKYFTSIVAAVDIPKGTKLTQTMLASKRPGTGVSPFWLRDFYGRTTLQDITANTLMRWEYVC